MEFTIGLFVTGIFLISFTFFRLRKARTHRQLQRSLAETYDVTSLDFSGNTQYASCISNQWVMSNITRKSHSKIGAKFQEHLANNTLLTAIWFGIIIGLSSMFITLLLVESLRAYGTVIFIFLLGILIALGPGGPRYSENLLDDVGKNEITDLKAQDFVYIKIANDTILKSAIVTLTLGILFVVISPWGELIPVVLAQAISIFVLYLILDPAMTLLNVNFVLAIAYIAGIIGVSSLFCAKLGKRITSQEEETPTVQW
jgi:hypothetical protein